MASFYHLKVVTPERTLVDEQVEFLICRSVEGEIGILAHHMHLVTPLVPHVCRITPAEGAPQSLVVSGGFLQVGRDETVLLADAAERPHEIDKQRAEAARDRAQERLGKHSGGDVDVVRAQLALARAENRLGAV